MLDRDAPPLGTAGLARRPREQRHTGYGGKPRFPRPVAANPDRLIERAGQRVGRCECHRTRPGVAAGNRSHQRTVIWPEPAVHRARAELPVEPLSTPPGPSLVAGILRAAGAEPTHR